MNYIKRILGFIPFALLALIGVIFLYFRYLINYIRFGGEAIFYTHKNERKTIKDIYNKITENYVQANIQQCKKSLSK